MPTMIGRPLNMDRMPTMARAIAVAPTCRPVTTACRHAVVLRCSTRLDATTSKDMLRPLRLRPLLGECLAQQALRTEHQHHHEERESDQIAKLVGCRNTEP